MKYDAFISYRHSDLDMYIAKKVHKALETFKVPRSVAKKSGKKKIKRVFRDQEELPIGSDLGNNIAAALEESEYLLVICSPRTPESYWVKQEITNFIKMHDREHVLAILIEGEPNESFPEELLKDENGNPVEPLAADVRGSSRSEMNKKFKTEIMRLAAPILSCTYDDLRQRHRERRMKKIIASVAIAGSIISALGIGFGLYNAKMAAEIRKNYQEKQKNQSKYLADTSLDLLENGDREAAVLVALSALPGEGNERPYTPQAEYALCDALYMYESGNEMHADRLLHHDFIVSNFEYSENGDYVTTKDTANNVMLWRVEDGAKVATINPIYTSGSFISFVYYANVVKDRLVLIVKDGIFFYDLNGNPTSNIPYDGSINNAFANLSTGEIYISCINCIDVYDVLTEEKLASYSPTDGGKFTSRLYFSPESKYIATAGYSEEDGPGFIYLISRDTGEIFSLGSNANSFTNISVNDNGELFSVGYYGDIVYTDAEETELFWEKHKFGNPDPVWVYDFNIARTLLFTSASELKIRSYEDTTVHNETIFALATHIYTLDSETGELIKKITVANPIENLLISSISSAGYAAEDNGNIDVYNLTTGLQYTSATITIGHDIEKIGLKNGVLCVQGSMSPDVDLYKYHEGPGMKEIVNSDNSISRILVSDDESFYAIKHGYGSSGTTFDFYDSKTDEKKGSVEVSEAGYETYSGFISDEEFLYAESKGRMLVYNIKTGTTEDFELIKDEDCIFDIYYGEAKISSDRTKLFLYWSSQYYVADIPARTVKQYSDNSGIISGIASSCITNDGKLVYLVKGDETAFVMNTEDGSIVKTLPDNYKITNGTDSELSLVMSPSEKYLAVCCRDGCIRLYDIESGETVDEIPFVSTNSPFIRFSADEKKLFLQGDDYYFRIYNLETKSFDYISSFQTYKVTFLYESEDGKTVSYGTIPAMVILDVEEKAELASIPGGAAYISKYEKVLSTYLGKAYSFPHATLEDLKKEAERQFPGASLSEDDKIKYHVD
ncbi:MAG: toll/interleukin-1 receptor domain-containing protein [Lachnospiraceae bacterium]|nr:toll/interleukin-1 receptor domain-containing protein [Lachnospiraceae bacterium]